MSGSIKSLFNLELKDILYTSTLKKAIGHYADVWQHLQLSLLTNIPDAILFISYALPR